MLRLALSVVVALLVAGCSPSSSADDGGPKNGLGFTSAQLCALVTTADVSTATNSPMNDGVPDPSNNAASCSWQSPDAQVGATIAAIHTSEVGQLPYGLQNSPGAHVTEVKNLGDSAYFAEPASGPFAELDIAVGTRAIDITVGDNRDPGNYTMAQQETAEKAIGTVAVPHM